MVSEIRHASRSLLRTPGFTLIALLTLALGIGVNTSMYTLLDSLLFRLAPFPQAEQLVSVVATMPQNPQDGLSFREIEEMRAQSATGANAVFSSLTTWAYWSDAYAEPGQPAEQLNSIDASAEFFQTFGVQPILGRTYTADEEAPGRNQVALLSHAFWQTHFGGDPAVIGRTLRLNSEQVTVIGVMPASFKYPLFFGRVDLWRPITLPRFIQEDRNNHLFNAVGRMNPNITPEQVTVALQPLAARWAKDYPQTSKGRGFRTMLMNKATMDSVSVLIVWLLFGLSGSVLLIACANLANLQLARATTQSRALAIRSALGASRWRLVRHQLTESMLLALAGGAGGILLAFWLNDLLSRAIRIGDNAGGGLPLTMNPAVIAVTVVVSLGTGIIFGIVPAWLASRTDLVNTLKQQARGSTSGRSQHFIRHSLIVAEVALALALLGAAGIMVRGFGAMLKKNVGWDTNRVLVANIHLPEQSTYDTEDKRRLAIEKLQRRLAAIPGIEQSTVCTTAPVFGYSRDINFLVEGQTPDDPSKQPLGGYTMVDTTYFATMGIPLREGRNFSPDLKADSPPVVIIGESLARKFWPNTSAVGRRIGDHFGGKGGDDKVIWREIIGVVPDIQFALNMTNPETTWQIYKPIVNEPWGYLHLIVRSEHPATFKQELRRAVADVDPDVAVQELYTIPESVDRFSHNIFVVNDVLVAFALLGLVLAAIGLYGVISNIVAQRTGEFGIRLALGARPADILGLVLGKGVNLTIIGLVIGAMGSYGLNALIASQMPRVAASDPITITGVALVLFAVSLLACWLPARRATKVDPMIALRAE